MSKPLYAPVDGFPWYLACSDGYVINTESGLVLKNQKKKTGYREVCLYDEYSKPHYFLLHRIIATCFCENKESREEVNHIDGDKGNNKSSNLEWVSRAQNLKHAFEQGLRKDDVSPKKVKAINIETGETMEFPSIYKAARHFGISQGNICLCCKGERPYASGFYWMYIQEDE